MTLVEKVEHSLSVNMRSSYELTEDEIKAIQLLDSSFSLVSPKFYYGVGVYNNDSMKTNHIQDSHLPDHIAYNLVMRPGRALFINGVCIHRGYLSQERADGWQERLCKVGLPLMSRNSAPYQ